MGGLGDDDITMHTGPRGYVEPTFVQRVLGRLVDGLVLLPPWIPILLLTHGRLRIALVLAVAAAYEITLVANQGRTIGKAALGTRVVDATYASIPTLRQSATRWLVLWGGAFVGLIHPSWVGLIGLWIAVVVIPAMVPPLHRGLHDRASHTIVTGDSAPITS